MRVLITASGIQDYIFNISKSKASARLRGRSALLGLVTDLCLLRLKQEFGVKVEEKRNAGSRLEVEIAADDTAVKKYLNLLRQELDQYARGKLDGQVWFAIAEAGPAEDIHGHLADRKLRSGQAALQNDNGWNENAFTFDRSSDERALEEREADNAAKEPDADLGTKLAHTENTLIEFRPGPEKGATPRILDCNISVSKGPAKLTVQFFGADGALLQETRKRMARHAPISPGEYRLLDLDEIAEEASGAKFLGVLKADLDNLGSTTLSQDLSRELEGLFTEQLESLMKPDYPLCYIVYSGGDDLFILGPWDQLVRFIAAFQVKLEESVAQWKLARRLAPDAQLTLSAGFKLAHPKSPVRYLAEDVEAALEQAKGRGAAETGLHAKNRITIFERALLWEDLRQGLKLADRFILALDPKARELTSGFLQRMQYYADQFRWFEAGHIEGLRMAPLLQDDWRRNRKQIEESLQKDLEGRIVMMLRPLDPEASTQWRVMDFASRFALYAAR